MSNENEDVKDVKSEIGEMLESFGDIVEDDKNEDKDDKSSNEDNKDEDIEGGDDKGSDNEDDKSDEDDKGDEDKDDEPDEKDKIILDLRAKLAEKSEVGESKYKEEKVEKEEPIKFEEQDFVGELDIEELVHDPKEFNKLLNNIYQKAVTDTRQILGEGVLRSIPDIVKTNIGIMTNLKKASEKFYEDNEDLKPFKKVVAAVFEEITSEHPDKKYDEVLNEVGDEVRKRLDLKKESVKKKGVDDKGNPPKLPRKSGKAGDSKDNKPDLSPLQDDIASMNKTLGR